MPAILHNGDILNKLPPGVTGVDIKSLTPFTDLKDKYVQATIQHRYQFNKEPEPSIKMIVRNNESSTIDLLAIGQVAVDLDICVQGDVLIFLTFEVEACPGHSRRACQMIVDDTRDVGSLVWIIKESAKSKGGDQPTANQSTSLQPKYSYKSLAEVEVDKTVDVYGVVKFYKPPTKTSGSSKDYWCTVSLTDPSLESADDKLSCNIFNAKEDGLPILEVGNIIRFHRLKIQRFQGRKQGRNGPNFQWVIFRGSFVDREASSANCTFEKQDEDKVKSLLEWWKTNGSLMSSTVGKTRNLSEVQPKDFFDLVCQVIRIYKVADSQCTICRVWDGTKFNGPLKMSKEEEFGATVREDGALMEVSDGLAVDVYLFDNHVKSADSIKPGDFIQLTNLHAAVVSGQVEMTLHDGTWFNRGVVVLSKELMQVRNLEAVLNTIIKEKTSCDFLATQDSAAVNMCTETVILNKHTPTKNVNEKCIESPGHKNAQSAASVTKTNVLNSSYVELNGKSVMVVKNYSTRDNSEGRLSLTPTISDLELTDSDRQILNLYELSQDSSDVISRNNQLRSPVAQSGFIQHDSPVAQSGFIQHDSPVAQNRHIQHDSPVAQSGFIQHDSPVAQSGFIQHDSPEISSDSSQSLLLSAYNDPDFEPQAKKYLAMKAHGSVLQDSNISSSGTSTGSQCLPSTITNDEQQVDLGNDIISPAGKDTPHSSQDSFYTACGENFRESTIVTELKSAQQPFLSLKRKLDSSDVTRDDIEIPLTGSKRNVLSQNSKVLCLDTVEFTESIPAAQHSPHVAVIEETERNTAGSSSMKDDTSQQSVCGDVHTDPFIFSLSQSSGESVYQHVEDSDVAISSKRGSVNQISDEPMRCMLRTASTVVGHTLVTRSSLKEVLEHTVPHKFKVLVRVQEYKPRPANAASLVHFICITCHYCKPVASIQAPLNSNRLEHLCPRSATGQPIWLEPTIIASFVLCEGEHSLVAYLLNRAAVQFLGSIEPSQILSDNETAKQVEKWFENLCPKNSKMSDRPLLECCIFSYDTEGGVRYQIYDTILV